MFYWGWWLGKAKVSCVSLRHRGVQLSLAYRWERPAILAAGKGRGGMFLHHLFPLFHSFSSFSPVPLSLSLSLSLSSPLLSLLSLFSLSLGDDTKWPTRVDVSLNTNTIILSLLHGHTHARTLSRAPSAVTDRRLQRLLSWESVLHISIIYEYQKIKFWFNKERPKCPDPVSKIFKLEFKW